MQDTAEEVRALRQQGRPGRCRLYGRERQRPDARTIYGQDLVRIQRMDQLAPLPANHPGGDSGAVRVSMCKYIVKVIIFPAADIKRRNCNRSFSFQPVEKSPAK